jgi:hypothetical protein
VDWYCFTSSFRTARVTTSTVPDPRTNQPSQQLLRGIRHHRVPLFVSFQQSDFQNIQFLFQNLQILRLQAINPWLFRKFYLYLQLDIY